MLLNEFRKEKTLEHLESLDAKNYQQRMRRVYEVGESIRNNSATTESVNLIETRQLISETMDLINELILKGYKDPRLLSINNRLLALVEASDNVFDNPLLMKEQHEIAKKIAEDALNFRILSKVDTSIRDNKVEFSNALELLKTKRGKRLKKIQDHIFFPTHCFGLYTINISYNSESYEKAFNVEISYPAPDNENGKKIDLYSRSFTLAADGSFNDNAEMPREIGFTKFSDVLMDVKDEIERYTSFGSTDAYIEFEEKEEGIGIKKSPRGPRGPEVKKIVDPARERVLANKAEENEKEILGKVNLDVFFEKMGGFKDYKLYIFDTGIALWNDELGNATYFSRFSENEENFKKEDLPLLVEAIENDEESFVLNFILANLNEGFINGTPKLELRKLENVTTIIHNGAWQEKLGDIFKEKKKEE